jgi:hypothetical protein
VVVDATDRPSLERRWLSMLPQAYGYAATLRYAEAHGYQVATDEIEQDGTRRLVLRR